MNTRKAAVLLCVLTVPAAIGLADDLKLDNLPELPAHWKNEPMQGIDSRVGRFTSDEKDLVIRYDIGKLAGEYASPKHHPNRKWLRSGRLAGSSFRYLLDEDDTLYVTFPDEGPANFWAKVGGQDDIDYVVELLARHREKMLKLPGTKPSGDG